MAQFTHAEKMQLRQQYQNLWHTDLLSTMKADCPCLFNFQYSCQNSSLSLINTSISIFLGVSFSSLLLLIFYDFNFPLTTLFNIDLYFCFTDFCFSFWW